MAKWKHPEKRYSISTPHAYRFYKKYATHNVISLTVYREVIKEFHKFVAELLLEGHCIYLPKNIGTIRVRGSKTQMRVEDGKIKGLPISWGKTFKYWNENPKAKEEQKVIYCLNQHTDGVKYKIVWNKRNLWLHNKQFYYFSPTRHLKRTLSKMLNDGNYQHFTINYDDM